MNKREALLGTKKKITKSAGWMLLTWRVCIYLNAKKLISMLNTDYTDRILMSDLGFTSKPNSLVFHTITHTFFPWAQVSVLVSLGLGRQWAGGQRFRKSLIQGILPEIVQLFEAFKWFEYGHSAKLNYDVIWFLYKYFYIFNSVNRGVSRWKHLIMINRILIQCKTRII